MTPASATTPGRAGRWLPWAGGLLGLIALAWVLRGFDVQRFRGIVAGADLRWLALVPLSILAEQLVRAWKWRQLLHPLRAVGVLRLFGTIMAGYLLAILVPFGFGTIARSWLVARREGLKLPSVLATVAVDRLTDGIVFACLVPLALFSVVFDDPTGGVRAGLAWGGAGSFLLFATALLALVAWRRETLAANGRIARAVARVPKRFAPAVERTAVAFAAGLAWPREPWRGVGVLVASATIKLLAATNLLWAGLAIDVLLEPAQYLFLVVFLGFLMILGHFLRFIGSFVVGGVFALGLFGVAPEPALALVLMVETMNLLCVAAVGALSLWAQGVALSDVRAGGAAERPVDG